MPHVTAVRLGVLAAAAFLTCSASAGAQSPAPPALTPNTITVTGTGEVKPTPADAKRNESIAAAVEEAKAAATPRALADGLARATRLAQLAGMKLGSLLAIAEGASAPFGFYGPYGQEGTFGPGRFCGTIRSSTLVKTKSGKRKRIVRTRRGCRVPREVSQTLTMTFAATAG
jgi:uncharacterized protein YggE